MGSFHRLLGREVRRGNGKGRGGEGDLGSTGGWRADVFREGFGMAGLVDGAFEWGEGW